MTHIHPDLLLCDGLILINIHLDKHLLKTVSFPSCELKLKRSQEIFTPISFISKMPYISQYKLIQAFFFHCAIWEVWSNEGLIAPLSAEKITSRSRRPLTLLWHLHSAFSFLAETTSLRKQRSKTYSAISDHESSKSLNLPIKYVTPNSLFRLACKRLDFQDFHQIYRLSSAWGCHIPMSEKSMTFLTCFPTK